MNLATLERKILFLTLLFLPTQLGRHFWPDFSYIYSLRVDYLSPTIYFWDLLVVSLLTVFILQRKTVNKLALNLFLFFILTQALSIFTAVSPGVGLVRLEQYISTGLFGVYLASLKWKDLKERLYLPLSMAVLGESVLAILQFLKEGSIGFWILGERTFSLSTPGIAKFNFQGVESLRPYATFPHPNTLAAFLVLTVPILILTKKITTKTKAFTLSLFLSAVTVLLTVSRTAIVAGVIELTYFLKGKGFLVATVAILILSPFLYTRFESVFNYDNLSVVRREEFINTSLNLFTSSPLFGIGLNNFIPVSSSSLSSGENRFLQPAHNIFLLTLSETGIVGLVGLSVLIGYPLWKVSPSRLTLIWLVSIFLGVFDHYFLTQPQGLRSLFLIWGLSLSRIWLK